MTEQTAPPAGRHLAAEIATQPDDWLRAAAAVADARGRAAAAAASGSR